MVRDMDRHDEPLRQGGIAGNRFFLRLRNLGEVPNTLFRSAASHAIECVERDGFPNYYGEQRFGLQARNPMIGKKILLDKQLTHRTQLSKKEMGGDYRDEATRKVQSLASFLFNRYIQKRRAANMYATILE